MNKVKVAAAFLFSLFTYTQAAAQAINLLENPGFEGQMAGWTTSEGDAVFSATTSTKVSGSYSAMGVEAEIGSLGRLYQDFTSQLVPGQQYKITAWLKTENVNGCGFDVRLSWTDAAGWTVGDQDMPSFGKVTGTTDWAYYESGWLTVDEQPPEASRLLYSFDFCAGTGTAYIDDAELLVMSPSSPVPTLSIYGLLFTSLGVLALTTQRLLGLSRRRKRKD